MTIAPVPSSAVTGRRHYLRDDDLTPDELIELLDIADGSSATA